MSLEHALHFDAERWYRARDLAARWSVHEITIFKWARDGRIPKPVKFGAASRWKGSAIIAHERALESGDA